VGANVWPRWVPDTVRKVDVLLVCSGGGHLLQLYMLRSAWAGFTTAWVATAQVDSRSLLADELVVFGYGPTTRHAGNFVRNAWLAWKLVRRLRPEVLVTTGAGIAVPFAWVARLVGTRVVFVESLTRISRPSLTCRLVSPVANRTYVQWPELASSLRGAHHLGTVIGKP
jgi:beta-1,4-N-acetylglucosaminyltransferase